MEIPTTEKQVCVCVSLITLSGVFGVKLSMMSLIWGMLGCCVPSSWQQGTSWAICMQMAARGLISRRYGRTWSPWQRNPCFFFLHFTPEPTFSRLFRERERKRERELMLSWPKSIVVFDGNIIFVALWKDTCMCQYIINVLPKWSYKVSDKRISDISPITNMVYMSWLSCILEIVWH